MNMPNGFNTLEDAFQFIRKLEDAYKRGVNAVYIPELDGYKMYEAEYPFNEVGIWYKA